MTHDDLVKALEKFEEAVEEIRGEDGCYDIDAFDGVFTQIFGENCTYCTCTPDNDTARIDIFADDIAETFLSLRKRGCEVIAEASQYIGDEVVVVISYK